MNINFKTYSQLAKDIRQAIVKLPKDIDLIVGVPRSGMIPAYMIGAFLNLPVASLDEYLNNIKTSSGDRPLNFQGEKIKKVLIVDDSVNLGNALKRVKERIVKKADIKHVYFAVYATKESSKIVDVFASICEQPRIFQWNYLYHGILADSCFDIDGVLCVDPTSDQNDDGSKYVEFILNAEPLYIPRYKIKSLVTSRLEKYRSETEEWLRKNNVQYENLFMLDLPTKEDRIKMRAHGKFKAEVYRKLSDCILFIESSRDQAIEIANISKKPVICLETDEFFDGNCDELMGDQMVDELKKEMKLIRSELTLVKSSKFWKLRNLYMKLFAKYD